jgi:hypothetical protein
LNGSGTENINMAMREIIYQPLYAAFRPLLYDWFPRLKEGLFDKGAAAVSAQAIEDFSAAVRGFFSVADRFRGADGAEDEKRVSQVSESLDMFSGLFRRLKPPAASKKLRTTVKPAPPARKFLGEQKLSGEREIAFLYAVLQSLGAPALFEEWSLYTEARKFFSQNGAGGENPDSLCLLLKILLKHGNWFGTIKKSESPAVRARTVLEKFFDDPDIQRYAGLNRYQGEVYFNKEGFLSLIWWLCVISPEWKTVSKIAAKAGLLERWLNAYEKAGYRLPKLFELLDPGFSPGTGKTRKKAKK